MKKLHRAIARLAAVALCALNAAAFAQEPVQFAPYPPAGTAGTDVSAETSAQAVSLRSETAAHAAATEFVDATEFGSLEQNFDAQNAAATKCDAKKMAAIKKAFNTAYKPLFYDNNFSYITDPCYDDWWIGDRFKQLNGPHCTALDIGGQYRARLHNERNFRGFGLNGRDDDFLLHRTRLFANWQIGDNFRFYGEYLDAVSNYENFPPRGIEENRSELTNLFFDAKVWDFCEGDLWFRIGRQELLYGAQRLVSPLDWANTRRTFEGLKLFYRGTDWDVDGFWTNPVALNPLTFDSPDQNREFMGLYATYKGTPNRTVDLYALRFIQTIAAPQPFEYNTFGARFQGSECSWLWDCEAAYQGGNLGADNHSAGFFTLGGGRKWEERCWQPQLMVYYDWASGSDELNNGFNQLFPLGHKYLGFMDLFGRQNIEDANVQLTMKPHEKLTFLAWYHAFFLQNGNGVPYNVVNLPYSVTPGGSQYLGQELDLLLTWNFHPRQELMVGYSHFWHGSWFDTNPGAPFAGDADFVYTQYTINF